MVDLKLLIKYGAVKKVLKPNQILFRENDEAYFYYQIIHGKIKMNNYNEAVSYTHLTLPTTPYV